MKFILGYKLLLFIVAFLVTIFFVYFYNLGSWPLLDTDETRYVNMSRIMLQTKDFFTLYLEGNYFFEKPPLYFWIICLSFKIFNSVNEFTARIPMVISAIIPCIALYFTGAKIVSKRFGFISAMILATTFEYIVFAKISMLDMILSPLIILSTMCGFLTFYVQKCNKKYFWWMFYIFSALAVMTKGIPGFVIPFGTMFFAGIYTKNFKEFFKPQFILIGFILFFLIVLPWHILMFKLHDPLFFQEYIIKHHVLRYIGSQKVGRLHDWYYYIPTFIIGFLPWALSLIFSFIELIKTKGVKQLNNFYTINLIGFLFTMIFFSIAGTKLVTYILPVYLFTSIMCAYTWDKYIFEDKFNKSIKLSVYITNSLFIMFGIAMMFVQFILPSDIFDKIKEIQILMILLMTILPIIGIFAAVKNKKITVFATYIIFTAILSSFAMPKMINIWYKFGQNDLMSFAKYTKAENKQLSVCNVPERFSISYYYGDTVKYLLYKTPTEVENTLQNTYMIIETKDFNEAYKNIKYKTIKSGDRYSLIEKTK